MKELKWKKWIKHDLVSHEKKETNFPEIKLEKTAAAACVLASLAWKLFLDRKLIFCPSFAQNIIFYSAKCYLKKTIFYTAKCHLAEKIFAEKFGVKVGETVSEPLMTHACSEAI